MKTYKIYDEIWKKFSTILPLKKVGAIGDNRTYENVCCLRVFTSVDGMTAKAYKFNHDFLIETANKIVNEVKGVNRVTLLSCFKPPGTISWITNNKFT